MQIPSVSNLTSMVSQTGSAFNTALKTASSAVSAEKTIGKEITSLLSSAVDVAKEIPVIGSIIDIIA